MRASLVVAVVLISGSAAHGNAFQRVTVQRDATPGAVIDCYIWQEQPDYNGGGSDTLYLGLNGASDKLAMIRFDTSAIPTGARVVSASMTLQVTSNGGIPIDVRRVTQTWTELEPTWGTFSDAMQPGTPEATFTPVDGVVSVDLTQLVQSWVADPSNNFGLALSQATMTAASTFASSDWAVVSERPKLDLVFDQPPPQRALITALPPALEASCDVPLAYSLRAHVPSGRFELAGSKGTIGVDSGLFTWTPSRSDRGVHSFAIKVDDAGRTGELQLDVNVQCARGLGVGAGCSSAPGLGALALLAWLRLRRRSS